MVLNSSNLVMNNLMGNETRRLLNRSLEKEGVCTPGAGLVYVISERASERFISIEDFSERIQGEIETLSGKKMTTLMWLCAGSNMPSSYSVAFCTGLGLK